MSPQSPSSLRLLPVLLLSGLSLSALRAAPVINEIYFHPPQAGGQLEPTGAEDLSQEWLEIYNPGPGAVDLTGWKIGRGIDYAFPAGQSLAAGAHAVVCADPAAFAAAHPGVTPLTGKWTGDLSNIDDTLELADPTGAVLDKVHYGTDGDWARRRQILDLDPRGYPYGWLWLSAADGGGKSLELMNSARPHDEGQNWQPSVADGGTPGAANSRRTDDAAPFVLKTKHSPEVPNHAQTVRVTAEVTDESKNGLTVKVNWRVSAMDPPAFTAVVMKDDGQNGDDIAGDSVFTGTIPAQPALSVVEYYVEATDATGHTRAWPASSSDDGMSRGMNALYQVDDEVYTGAAPLYRVIMPAAELDGLDHQPYSGNNHTAQKYLGAFVTKVGRDVEVRQLSSVRIRGNGSRSLHPRSVRVDFLKEDPWQNNSGVNLGGRYTFLQIIGARLAQAAGIKASDALAVSVRFNGQNRAAQDYVDPVNGASSSWSAHFGLYASVEPIGRDYVKHHYPLELGGDIYTKRGGGGSEWNPAPADGTGLVEFYTGQGWEKQNNTSQADFTGLDHFIQVMSENAEIRGPSYLPNVSQVLNVPQFLKALAVETFLTDGETKIFNGRDDDYSLYRAPDGRMQVLTHDFDTILGSGDSSAIGINRLPYTLFDVVEFGRGGDVFDKLVPLFLQPEVIQQYYQNLRALLTEGGPFAKAAFDDLVIRELNKGGWPASEIAAVRTSVIAFADARRADILSQISPALSATSGQEVISGYERTAAAVSGNLSGRFDAASTARVLVNGVAATLDFQFAAFTSPPVNLNPGINRITVEELDAAGVHLRYCYLDIWREVAPVAKTGAIAASTTWTTAGGPYQVTGDITVGNGVTLTIQPGTTVYMGPAASITTTGTGRLVAEGTAFQHIRFTRKPGTTDAYGTIAFVNGSNENRLVWCDFEYGAGKNVSGHTSVTHVNAAKALIDHCTYTNSDSQYFSSDAGSFIVSNSYFQTYSKPAGYPPANGTGGFGRPEMLHGVSGIAAGGYGIFKANIFGHTFGFNDVIDYTGGNRPGPILQFIDNIFTSATDDALDLDSTDAFISGNIFLHVHQDPARTDEADTGSAISGGTDNADVSEWTIYGNLFFNVDHAVLAKGVNGQANTKADRFVFVNNTIHKVTGESTYGSVGVDIAAFNFSDDAAGLPPPSGGAGALIENNVFSDCAALVANYDGSKLSVTMNSNILPFAWTGPGTGNVVTPDAGLRTEKFAALAYEKVERADDYTLLWRQAREAFALTPGSAGKGTGPGGSDKGGLIFTGAQLTGVPSAVTAANSATIRVGPAGSFNPAGATIPAFPYGFNSYQWKLDDGTFSAEVPSTTPITLTNLTPGTHTLQALGKNDAGAWQPAPTVAVWTVDPSYAPPVRINEVLATNVNAYPAAGAVSALGTRPDVIELFNPGAITADLSGWMISDDAAQPAKFVFPAGTTLEAGTYLTLIAGPADGSAGIHLGFALDGEGDDVILTKSAAAGGGVADSVSFGLQLTDWSIGRSGLANTWDLNTPTLGAANLRQPTAPAAQVRLNEWLAGSAISFREDQIELYNLSPLPASIGGCLIGDTPATGDGMLVRPLSFVAGKGFAVLVADGSAVSQRADHLSFKLSAFYDWIVLSDADGGIVDQVPVGREATDVSSGRLPDGSTNIQTLDFPSIGLTNVNGLPPTETEAVTAVLPFNAVWQYRDDLDTLPAADSAGRLWTEPGYLAGGWKSGPGPLGRDTGLNSTPNPGTGVAPFFGTEFSPYTSSRISYYFRNSFNWSGSTTGVSLRVSRWIDDGYLLYLNGQVIDRKNFSANPPLAWSDQSTGTVDDATAENDRLLTIPAGALLPGLNQLAAEVHQNGSSSSDITFGVKLDAVVTTSTPGQPDPVRERMRNLTDFLRITEIMFNPSNGADYEFVELQNLSPNLTLDLTGVRFSEGMDFVFPAMTLAPGAYVVVVKNTALFRSLYGSAPVVAGEFGGRLDNSGESLTLSLPDPYLSAVQRFRYEPNWFGLTAGGGSSLEITNPPSGFDTRAVWDEKGSWQASASAGGTPGGVTAGGGYAAWLAGFGLSGAPSADSDNDGLANPAEYGLGLNPLNPDADSARITPGIDGAGHPTASFTLPVSLPADVGYILETSDTLTAAASWTALASLPAGSLVWTGPGSVSTGAAANGRIPVTVTDPALVSAHPHRFTRLRFSVP